MSEQIFDTKQAAERAGRSVEGMKTLRKTGGGPRYHQWTNGRIYYRQAELDAWIVLHPKRARDAGRRANIPDTPLPAGEEFLTVSQAAKYLGVPDGTLSHWRYIGKGPESYKHGGRIHYSKTDLEAWQLKVKAADKKMVEETDAVCRGHLKRLGVELPPAEIKPMPPSVDEIVDKIFAMRSQEAIKHDDGKPRMDLIPPVALEEIAQVFAKGAEKYGEHNYRHGLKYSRIVGAAMRHINEFNAGIDLDADDGLPHLAHAACCLMMLQWMAKHRPDMDDRWKDGHDLPQS